MNNEKFSVWTGMFNSFEDAGGDLKAFDSEIWLNKQKDRVQEALQHFKTNTFSSKDYPLAIASAMILSDKKSIKILDFGGGMGIQYLDLISKVPQAKERVIYHVLDSHSSVENRPVEMDQFKNLFFHTDLNNLTEKVDVIHIGSTLQYIKDWKGLLKNLVSTFKPEYFIFSDLFAGSIPTYVSHQVFYDKKIPVNLLNEEEFLDYVTDEGYEVIFKCLFSANILGNEFLPMFDLREDMRIKKTLNLVFKVKPFKD
jgi:putative methyltransferase (TIGR04325 family)